MHASLVYQVTPCVLDLDYSQIISRHLYLDHYHISLLMAEYVGLHYNSMLSLEQLLTCQIFIGLLDCRFAPEQLLQSIPHTHD